MSDDIERFMALVKQEADKDEDFVAVRMREMPLYKLLEARYDNVEKLLEVALLKSKWLERMKDAMIIEWKRNCDGKVYRDSEDRCAELLVYYMSFNHQTKEIYDKCIFRYGKPKLLELAKEVVIKYPYSNNYNNNPDLMR